MVGRLISYLRRHIFRGDLLVSGSVYYLEFHTLSLIHPPKKKLTNVPKKRSAISTGKDGLPVPPFFFGDVDVP